SRGRTGRGNGGRGPPGWPDVGAAPSPFQPSLHQILAQPDQPFPPFTGAQHAAERDIACRIDVNYDLRWGIRAAYWQDQSIDWNGKASLIGTGCSTDGPCVTQGCTDDAFQQVAAQLEAEFPLVQQVLDYFNVNQTGSLAGVIDAAFNDASFGFTGIQNYVLTNFEMPKESPRGPDALGIINGILTIASGAASFVPVVGGIVSGASPLARG